MTDARVRINILLVAIATSYLTLGVANAEWAASLWWIYAMISGTLASANLILAHRSEKRRRH
jgi:hypothetical protein